jgi:hypothetical protein
MRHVLMIGLLVIGGIGLAACTPDPVRLYNPRNGMVATCQVNPAVALSQSANERCIQDYERQGYVRGAPPPAQ